jgi:Holliday junction resolvasome RuvABC endonuclease subunit
VQKYRVGVLTAETMSYPRNAATAAKMSMGWGVIAAVAEEFKLPVTQASPVKIKQAVTGSPTASKEEVMNALRRRYKGEFFPFQEAVPESQWEHGFDAVGSVVTCLESDVLRLARISVRGRESVGT